MIIEQNPKPIGLLGGTSWPSTIAYYELLNNKAAETFGEGHSANLLLRSISYHELRHSYVNDWPNVGRLLGDYLSELANYRTLSCIMICNNTLHKAYDELVRDGLTLNTPLVHIVDAVASQALDQRATKVLLLGTKFTMEDGFYQRRLETSGIEVIVPNESERNKIQEIQTQIALGAMRKEFKDYFHSLVKNYSTTISGVAVACTELPLVMHQPDFDVPIIGCIEAQVETAWQFASNPLHTSDADSN